MCGVKSTTCHSSSISCAVHSRPVLLTQNKDGSVSLVVKLRTAHRITFQESEMKGKFSKECRIFSQMCADGRVAVDTHRETKEVDLNVDQFCVVIIIYFFYDQRLHKDKPE